VVDNQPIWVAPTQARIHEVVSSDAGDTLGGAGSRTIRVWGLETWESDESFEDVSMNGLTPVSTIRSYVIIHRVEVLTKGATDVNIGKITVTATVDGTVTAQINVGVGQTLMGIYGIPRGSTGFLTHLYFSFDGMSLIPKRINHRLLMNPEPDVELLNFLTKFTGDLSTSGGTFTPHDVRPLRPLEGPCILKLQGEGSFGSSDISGGFNLFVVGEQ